MTATLTTRLPEPMEIREFFEGLLGKEVSVLVSAAYAPTTRNPATFAVYADEYLHVRALGLCDLKMSVWSGSALGLIPPSTAEGAVEAALLDEEMQENLYEVFNVAASLFNAEDTVHLKLHTVHHIGEPVPHDMSARALTLGRRIDLKTEVEGYGPGRFAFVLC